MDWWSRAKEQGRINGRVLFWGGLAACVWCPIDAFANSRPIFISAIVLLYGILFTIFGRQLAKWGDSNDGD